MLSFVYVNIGGPQADEASPLLRLHPHLVGYWGFRTSKPDVFRAEVGNMDPLVWV